MPPRRAPCPPCTGGAYRLVSGTLGLLLLGAGLYALAWADDRSLLGWVLNASLVVIGGNAVVAAWRAKRCWLGRFGPLP